MTVIYLGADHAGFALKEQLKKALTDDGHRVIDLGAARTKPDDDYPDYAFRVAQRAVKHSRLGVLVCGSSEGVCIAANKVLGARAVSAWSVKTAKLARAHNNANLLCLSGWDLTIDKAMRITRTFLNTPFSKEERHIRRLQKIERYEK